MRATDAPLRSLEAIAERLAATRRALGLNQRQLCHRAGIEPNTYNQWEKAKGRPDLDKALLLCDEFGLSLDWIYRGDPIFMPSGLVDKLRAAEAPTRRPIAALKKGRG